MEFSRIGKFAPAATDLLEIGTGTGRAGVQATNLGFRSYTGVEPTKALAAHSRSQYGLTIIEDALPNLEQIPDSTYDAVFSMHVLEHAPSYYAAREWCLEMARVMRPGGRLLIAAPNILDYRGYFWDGDWSHGWPTTTQRVTQVLQDLGLEIEFAGNMHLGRLGGLSAAAAHIVSFLLPTRLGDLLTKRIVGRPLASGLKIAVLWGLVYVVARKPASQLL